MPHTLTIPLTDTFYDEVEDSFIDKKIDSHQFIWELIKGMCKDAKAGKLNKSCSINLVDEKTGQIKPEFVKMKDVDLKKYTLPSDPTWLPKDMERKDVRNWEHKVTDKTMEYIQLYCQFVGIRFEKYNESVMKVEQGKVEKLKQALANATDETRPSIQKSIDEAAKRFEELEKSNAANLPKCIEHCVYNQTYPQLHQEVIKNMDSEFDKENEEMYPQKKAVPNMPPQRPAR
jgi:hypothetical protein